MIRTALIGYGAAAQTFHHPLIAACADLQLAAIVSRSQSFADIPVYRDTDSLLGEADITLAVISTPNDSHYPIAKQCLIAKKHVVLEKPVALTLQEAQELFAIAQANGVLLSIFHNRRLDGDFLTVQQLIVGKRLGNIHTFRSHWDRFRPEVRQRWREDGRAGSGIWYDLAPHLIDQALLLFGMPEALTATIRAIRPHSPSSDYAHVALHYADKEILLHTSPYTCAPTPRFIIEGDGGNFRKYGLDGQEMQLKAGMHPHDEAFGLDDPAHFGTLYHPDGKQETIATVRGRFTDYYANVAEAVRGESALAVKAQEALDVMRVMLLAQESAVQGKRLFL